MIAKFFVVAATATVLFSGQAEARRLHFWWQQDQQYDDPNFDPYADQPSADSQDLFVQEQFNQDQYDQYMREMGHAKRRVYQDSYYEPKVETPGYKLKKATKPVKKQVSTSVVKPTTKATSVQTASIANRFGEKVAPKAVNCSKGATIVSGYGFTGVASKSCTGATFVYNAVRSGKNFEINVNATTGELTNVKRL